MSSRSGLYPREAVHRLASPQTSFGARSSRIHFSPTDGLSYERVPQFNLEWTFSKLDSGFQSWAGFRIPKPGFRIPQAKNSWIPESGFPYMGQDMRVRVIGKHSTAPAVITVLTQTNRNCRLSEQQCCIWSVWFILIRLYITLDTKCCWQYHFHGKLAINPYKDKSRNQILPDKLLHSAQYFIKNYMYLHKLCTFFGSFLTAGRLLL